MRTIELQVPSEAADSFDRLPENVKRVLSDLVVRAMERQAEDNFLETLLQLQQSARTRGLTDEIAMELLQELA